jgi:hypothetical protein
MEKLADYSSDLRPDLRMEDFSSEALVRLWRAAGLLYCGMSSIYYTVIREKLGEEMAHEIDAEMWKREAPLEMRRMAEAMNIRGNDVEALLKTLQVDIGGGPIWPEFRCELKNKNHGYLYIKRCRGIDYWARHKEGTMQQHGCYLDIVGFQHAADCFNPKIKARALKLPPTKGPDENVCEWEFKLEE